MQLRASLGCLCLMLAGCQHLPEGVKLDLGNGVVAVGPCVCKLPPIVVAAPAPAPRPAPAAEQTDVQPR